MRRALAGMLAVAVLAAAAPAAAQSSAAGMSPRVDYMLYCSGCHGMDGTGSPPGGIPTFVDVVGAFTGDPGGRLYMANVPGVVGANVDASKTARILNYVVETFAGPSRQAAAKPFDGAEIAELWSRRPPDIIGLRRDLVHAYRDGGKPVPPDYPWP